MYTYILAANFPNSEILDERVSLGDSTAQAGHFLNTQEAVVRLLI